MTVQQMINLLKRVKDKDIKVVIAHHCTPDRTEVLDAYDSSVEFVIQQ